VYWSSRSTTGVFDGAIGGEQLAAFAQLVAYPLQDPLVGAEFGRRVVEDVPSGVDGGHFGQVPLFLDGRVDR
jgi:hypothetical protein